MKQIIFRILSSVLFFGISFIFLFLILASRFRTYNAALAFCLLIAFCLATAYFLLRGLSQKKQIEQKESEEKNKASLQTLLLASEEEFTSWIIQAFSNGEKGILRPAANILYFPCSKRVLVWSRHSSTVTADLLLPAVRKIKPFDIEKAIVCTLNGISDECAGLFASAPDIFDGTKLLNHLKQNEINIPPCNKMSMPPLRKRFSDFLLQKKAPKKCIRYAIFLSLIAFFTPFRIYYWSCAALLIIFAVSLKLRSFFQSKKIL